MEIKIPKGKFCGLCEFRINGQFDDFCGLFMKKIPTFNKIVDCLLEFKDDGGEFEIARKTEDEKRQN
jgi:hypothetical protein